MNTRITTMFAEMQTAVCMLTWITTPSNLSVLLLYKIILWRFIYIIYTYTRYPKIAYYYFDFISVQMFKINSISNFKVIECLLLQCKHHTIFHKDDISSWDTALVIMQSDLTSWNLTDNSKIYLCYQSYNNTLKEISFSIFHYYSILV